MDRFGKPRSRAVLEAGGLRNTTVISPFGCQDLCRWSPFPNDGAPLSGCTALGVVLTGLRHEGGRPNLHSRLPPHLKPKLQLKGVQVTPESEAEPVPGVCGGAVLPVRLETHQVIASWT